MKKRYEKTVALFLTVCMVLLVMQPISVSGNTSIVFRDVKDKNDHWAYETIYYMVENNAINGYDTDAGKLFKPDATISRQEFVKILIATLYTSNEIDQTSTVDFEVLDLKKKTWSTKYFKRAEATGMIDASIVALYDYSDEGIKEPITRGEIAYFIMNAEESVLSKFVDFDREFAYDKGFYMYMIKDVMEDNPLIASAAVDCYRYGIVSGYGDMTFRSHDKATRAEAATMVARLLDEKFRSTVLAETPYYPKNANGERMFRESCFVRPPAAGNTDVNEVFIHDKSKTVVYITEYIGKGYYRNDTDYYGLGTIYLAQYKQNFQGEEDKAYDFVKETLAKGVKDRSLTDALVDTAHTKMDYVVSNHGSGTFDQKVIGIDGKEYIIVAIVNKGNYQYSATVGFYISAKK